jgi:superfamily II DNA or RNA helicase
MPFTELTIKRSYDSYSSDLAKEFFDPVLSEAKVYLRAAAYFSSSSLRVISKGLSSLLSNGGEMKLIVAILVSDADYKAIVEGKKLVNEEILKIFSDESVISEMLRNDSVNALCKLVAAKRLDIKFIISKKGIFHMKFGVFKDHEGNLLSFSGSLNETYEGYMLNGEEIKVFRGWLPGESNYVEDDYSKFYSYWEGRMPREEAIISDLPPEAREKIEYAAQSRNKSKHKEMLALRHYQEAAIEYFAKSGFRAILEMATGTGKTFVALNCAKTLYEKIGNRLTIIVVPTENLIYQWKNEWKSFFGTQPYLHGREKRLSLNEYCSLHKERGAVVITYSSLSKMAGDNNFLNAIGEGNLIIADEAHWMGAATFSKAMLDNFEWRLGLSATPERMFDEYGTKKVLDYFGNNEFKYSLEEAINDGYLSQFSYFPHFCKLSHEEVREYERLTKRTLYFQEGTEEEEPTQLDNILFKRAKVTKKAVCKNFVFDKIIKSMHNSEKLDHLLIFFEDSEQLSNAQRSLMELNVTFNIINSLTSESDRSLYIERLRKGEISCLLSMRVMDEGIDIPSATRELIMASSSNQRQYIQRAGRILRKDEGKTKAEIYDIITYAEQNDCPDWLWKYELKAISKEIKRAMYFSMAATNQSECINIIHGFAKKFNISIWQ